MDPRLKTNVYQYYIRVFKVRTLWQLYWYKTEELFAPSEKRWPQKIHTMRNPSTNNTWLSPLWVCRVSRHLETVKDSKQGASQWPAGLRTHHGAASNEVWNTLDRAPRSTKHIKSNLQIQLTTSQKPEVPRLSTRRAGVHCQTRLGSLMEAARLLCKASNSSQRP